MATTTALTENSRQGIYSQIPACIGLGAWLNRDPQPGCRHGYDETPVGLVVYVRNDPVNLIDPDGRQARAPIQADWLNTTITVSAMLGGISLSEASTAIDFLLARLIWNGPWEPTELGGRGSKVGGSGGQIDYCSSNETNDKSLKFFSANKAAAQKIAESSGIPYEVILAVAAEETLWGTQGIVTSTNNYFGLHVSGENDKSHYTNQTDTYHATRDGWVATFAAASGFFDSGMAFALQTQAGQAIKAKTLSEEGNIAAILHSNGYGTTNPNYETEFRSVLRRVIGSSKCPGKDEP